MNELTEIIRDAESACNAFRYGNMSLNTLTVILTQLNEKANDQILASENVYGDGSCESNAVVKSDFER